MLPPRQRETNKRQKRVRCAAHLAFLRTFYCSVPLCQELPVEAHHISHAGNAGMGIKAPDDSAVPLCASHHRDFHSVGLEAFDRKHATDLVALAAEFAANSRPLKAYFARQQAATFTPNVPKVVTTLRDYRAQRKAER